MAAYSIVRQTTDRGWMYPSVIALCTPKRLSKLVEVKRNCFTLFIKTDFPLFACYEVEKILENSGVMGPASISRHDSGEFQLRMTTQTPLTYLPTYPLRNDFPSNVQSTFNLLKQFFTHHCHRDRRRLKSFFSLCTTTTLETIYETFKKHNLSSKGVQNATAALF